MSASREKKQRQGAGPDQKTLKVEQEQAARKRQTIIYSVIGGVVVVLVAALLIWNSGFFQARSTALTVGDESLSTAELSYYYYNARYSYAVYGSYLGFDTTKSDDEQFYNAADSVTYRDYFLEQAQKSAQQDLALSKQAIADGYTEADVKDSLNAQIDSMKSAAAAQGMSYAAYLRAVLGTYVTPSVYEKMLTRNLLAGLAANDKGTELYNSYSQDALDEYYKENSDALDTIVFSYLRFDVPTVSSTNEDGSEVSEEDLAKYQEEAKENAKQNAEAALEAVEGGSTFTSQAEKYDLTASGDHNTVVGTASVTSTVSEELLELDKDECKLVETENSYYVVAFHDRYLDDTPTYDVRHILARAENTTDDDNNAVAPTDEAWAAAKEKMDAIQAQWDSSDKTEDAFAALANEKSDDGDGTTGGLYERIYDGYFVPELNDWLFGESHKSGDVAMIRHEAEEDSNNKYWGYHLVYYVGENEPVWMATTRSALATAGRNEWIEELAANYPAALAGGANNLGK